MLEIYSVSQKLFVSIFVVEKLYYTEKGKTRFLERNCIYQQTAGYTNLKNVNFQKKGNLEINNSIFSAA
jgi:hypothetical protein